MTQREEVDYYLFAVLNSLIESIVKKVVNSPKSNGQIVEAVINNLEYFTPVAAFT